MRQFVLQKGMQILSLYKKFLEEVVLQDKSKFLDSSHILDQLYHRLLAVSDDYGQLLGLPGVQFLTGQSGFLAICPVKNMMLNWTISCPVLADLQNCTNFGQLILSKIIKIVATSCQI